MLSHELQVVHSSILVRLNVLWKELTTRPKVDGFLGMYDGHAAWVKTALASSASVKIRCHQLAYDTMRFSIRLTHQDKDARVHGQRVEVGVL